MCRAAAGKMACKYAETEIIMNILILSCGTRDLLVRYFKNRENGFDKVLGTDCSTYAPALYETDAHYIVPRMTDPHYLDTILSICRKEAVDAILPLQEDELHLIATHKSLFTDAGITPIVSDTESVDLCRDKFAFYEHLCQNNLPAIPSCKTYSDFLIKQKEGSMQFPVFLKPVSGCGSIGIQKVDKPELLKALCTWQEEEYLIQNYAQGEEFGADIYIDLLSHKPVSVFIKKKLRMRAGETEKSISYRDDALFDLICRTVQTLHLAGPIDMDIFRIDGKYYISEINPRFGGGYPHAYSCGVNFPRLLSANLSGKENADTIGSYEEGICMLKYTDLMIGRF